MLLISQFRHKTECEKSESRCIFIGRTLLLFYRMKVTLTAVTIALVILQLNGPTLGQFEVVIKEKKCHPVILVKTPLYS